MASYPNPSFVSSKLQLRYRSRKVCNTSSMNVQIVCLQINPRQPQPSPAVPLPEPFEPFDFRTTTIQSIGPSLDRATAEHWRPAMRFYLFRVCSRWSTVATRLRKKSSVTHVCARVGHEESRPSCDLRHVAKTDQHVRVCREACSTVPSRVFLVQVRELGYRPIGLTCCTCDALVSFFLVRAFRDALQLR